MVHIENGGMSFEDDINPLIFPYSVPVIFGIVNVYVLKRTDVSLEVCNR